MKFFLLGGRTLSYKNPPSACPSANLSVFLMKTTTNLGDKKDGGFLKQIQSTLIQEKLIKIGDTWKAL